MRAKKRMLWAIGVFLAFAPHEILAASDRGGDPVDSQLPSVKRIDTNRDSHSIPTSKFHGLWQDAAIVATSTNEIDHDLIFSRELQAMSMPTRAPSSTPATESPTSRPTEVPFGVPTPSPTSEGSIMPTVDCLDGQSREQYLLTILTPITAPSIIEDPTTPQGMAFDYLLNSDPYLAENICRDTIEQRYSLTTLYFATDGTNWINQDGWLGSEQECFWFGITCPEGSNLLSRIALKENNMQGSLPDEISAIFTTERMDFFANALVGSIPNGVANLTNILLLDLEQNQLDGPAFPQSVMGLSSLLAYRISENSLEGSIPTSIDSLANLQQLWAAENALNEEIPTEIGNLAQMESLLLYGNDITGSIPSELGNLLQLSDLRLQQNQLEFAIPTEIFLATKLTSLRLEENFLTGSIPEDIANLQSLVDFRAGVNSIEGQLPLGLGFLTNLETFVVQSSFISGQIPNVFGGLDQLDFLDLSNTDVNGEIPSSMFDMPSIRLIYLSNCSLTGTIPSNFGNPPLLRDLYLNGNMLSSSIPPIASGQLLQLNELQLQRNNLVGEMPPSICQLRTSVAGGILDDLFADCGGNDPAIACEFPACCNRCFDGSMSTTTSQRRTESRALGEMGTRGRMLRKRPAGQRKLYESMQELSNRKSRRSRAAL